MVKQKKKRKKKTPRQKLEERLWNLCRRYIRLRDGNTCQKCGKRVSGSNSHTSHVIPKSNGNILKYDDINLKVLCSFCHRRWWHKNPLEADAWFKWMFPSRYEYVMEQKGEYLKLTVEYLEEKIDWYEDAIVGLELI